MDNIWKYLEFFLSEIGVLTPLKQPEYDIPILITPLKKNTARFIIYYHGINQELPQL